MAIRALDFVTKLSSRLAYEILPVTTANVIGATLVNHYGHRPSSPPIVIQAPPSASEDAMVQSLREEHELIAVFMKRNQESARDPERSGSAATQVASLASSSLSLVDPPLPEPRPAAQKAVARLAPKPAARKKSALTEASGLSRTFPRFRQRSRRYRPPRRLRLNLSSSQGRGRSPASPAKCANGSRT
ncbi:MAG: hypothetical protein WCF81_19230 [Roseiarcus sp.]